MKVPPPRSRRTAKALLVAAGVFVLAGLGAAFTIFGEVALVLAALCAAGGAALMARSTDSRGMRFQAPPGWPPPPEGWVPPTGWTPESSWPEPPAGWEFWVSGRM